MPLELPSGPLETTGDRDVEQAQGWFYSEQGPSGIVGEDPCEDRWNRGGAVIRGERVDRGFDVPFMRRRLKTLWSHWMLRAGSDGEVLYPVVTFVASNRFDLLMYGNVIEYAR